MNCPICNSDMVKLEKWVPRPVRPYEDTANSNVVVTLCAMQRHGILVKRTQSDVIYTSTFVCPECGNLQFGVDASDLKHVLRVESDPTYE